MRTIQVVSLITVAPWLLGAPAMAQQPAVEAKSSAPATSPEPPKRGPRPGDVQKVFVVKNGRVAELARVLSVFPAEISSVDRSGLSVLAVSASPAVVAAIEETLKRLDIPAPPAKSVDVTGYILECSAKGGETASAPSELQDVITQLKRTFGYSDCGLGQTLFARAGDRTRFRSASGSGSGTYILTAGIEVDASQGAPIVRFRGLSLGLAGHDSGFSGDVDVRDGQRVVLGKLGWLSRNVKVEESSGAQPGIDGILVLTAKVVD